MDTSTDYHAACCRSASHRGVGLQRSAVAKPLDDPLAVVELDETGDRLAQLVDGAVAPRPQALLLEGLDPALGAPVSLRLTGIGRGESDRPSQASEPVKCALWYWLPQSWRTSRPRATSVASTPNRSRTGVIDRLQGGMECQTASADVSESARSHPYAP